MIIFVRKLSIIFSISLLCFSFTNLSSAQTTNEERIRLEAELKVLQQEEARLVNLLNQQKQQTGSIQRDITLLTTEIKRAQTAIKSKNVAINKLKDQIESKNVTIYELEERVDRQTDSLAQLIRKTNKIDDASIVQVLIGTDSISGFYQDVSMFSAVQGALKDSMDELRGTKKKTQIEKNELEERQREEADKKVELEKEKKNVETNEKQKQQLLNISKNKEVEYQVLVENRRAEAGRIRARLFQLAGGVQGGGIAFGDAVKYAEYASEKTGVRTAFILGILKQETNLGSNVGLCMLTNENGESRGINSGTVFKNGMKPERDVQPFLSITKKLGIDAFQTRISCPIANVPGWGGAMGPSQFIPSTWVIFADRIAQNFGVSTANPWNPEHAIMATAVYLKDLKADRGGDSAEREAACRYYSGVSCTHPTVKNVFYANAVMKHADTIERDIACIENDTTCSI